MLGAFLRACSRELSGGYDTSTEGIPTGTGALLNTTNPKGPGGNREKDIETLFRTRRELLLENLVLRQQLMVLRRKHPRPRLAAFDKLFWVIDPAMMAGMETSPDRCHSRDRSPMPSGRLPAICDGSSQAERAVTPDTDLISQTCERLYAHQEAARTPIPPPALRRHPF
jgi:hypothetical protein